MWSIIILVWLALQLPVGLAVGRFIGCPRKAAKRTEKHNYPDVAHAA
jgi:hypothetical protein